MEITWRLLARVRARANRSRWRYMNRRTIGYCSCLEAAPGDGGYGLRASGNGKLRELLQIFRIDMYAEPKAHENGTLTCAWALEHS